MASLLASHSGIEIAGSFADPAEVGNLMPELRPDVIVVDGQDDSSGGSELAVAAARATDAAVILLAPDPDNPGVEVYRGGVRAILSRDVQTDELVSAIYAVSAGFVLLAPEQLAALLPPSTNHRQPGTVSPENLTPRETEVLRLMAEGVANKAIAWKLGISEHTVKFHVASILAKLRAGSRTEAVAIGVRRGLILL